MRVKKKNAITLEIPITDQDDVALTTLASTTVISFMLKENSTDADAEAVLTKTKTDFAVDSPSTGTLTLVLSRDDMDIPVGFYYIGLEMLWSSSNGQEVNLSENDIELDTIEIYQDIIRGS